MQTHEAFMQLAITEARKGVGYSSPNPSVGALVVNNGAIVGAGYHRQAGTDHGELVALKAAGDKAQGGTLYVTLEPCNHHGRTPPCTEAILNAGIAEVVYAIPDPNPKVAGQGHRRLANAGVRVISHIEENSARDVHRFFLKHITTGRPYVIAKFAASLDGKIATHTGDSQWITGPEARQAGHALRNQVDAILVGANTAIMDDPQLTTRLPQDDIRHPVRLVLDSSGRVPLSAKLFDSSLPGQTMVVTTVKMSRKHHKKLKQLGIELIEVEQDAQGRCLLPHMLDELGRRNITSLLVEGGSDVHGAFFAENLVDEVWAFLAPLIIGGREAPPPVGNVGFATLTQALRLKKITIEQHGQDVLITGRM